MPLGSNDKALKPERKMKSNSVVYRVCVKCGKEFRAKSKRYNFCPECYNRINASFSESKEPRKCVICGLEFVPRTSKSHTCGKLECQKAFQKEKSQKLADEKTKLEFSKGRIWLLDMEKWRWIREERGKHDG